MCPFKYYDFMRICKDTKYLRLKLVQFARQEGVKPAARAFGCSPKTVRKWRDRYDGSLKSLSERSRAPHNHPNRITEADERKIVRAHNRLPTWGARRLKRDLELPYSVKTIAKVRKKRGLTRKYRRKKHQTKRCLREVKKRWRFMQQIDIDTKHLYDMPEYWPLIEDPVLAVCYLDRLHYKTRLHKFNQRGDDVGVLPCPSVVFSVDIGRARRIMPSM